MRIKLILPLPFILLPAVVALGKPTDYLEKCWARQGAGLRGQSAAFSYRENANELEHSLYPWQQTTYEKKGRFWTNGSQFMRQDTVAQSQKTYYSKTQVSAEKLLFLDYGSQNVVEAITPAMLATQLIGSARYSPLLLLQYFRQHPVAPQAPAAGLAEYQTRIQSSVVRLFIRTADKLVERIEVLSPDELFGDALMTFTYRDYAGSGKLTYARTIEINKINGKLRDKVTIGTVATGGALPVLLRQPTGYQLRAAEAAEPPVTVQHYRPNLHFVELKHTDDRVLIVEFRDFLVVAEAPLTSANGELIIREARNIAPGKPIRYFVFGHYHPHYLGGARAFIHRGATVLCGPGDAPYVRYLASAPRTLQPDSLHLNPRPLQIEEIATSKTITDGQFSMQIHFIGNESAHTNDYLVYYFPSEKLLFEDDLVWIKREGPATKASPRQAGLYQAIKSRNLNVETVVQSWPVADYGVKTIIPFADIEQAMQVK
jgi:glyoxylase-like metal-dependent hydrolase (beta-lactamase superfamily II)